LPARRSFGGVLGICDLRHQTPRQSRRTLAWPKGTIRFNVGRMTTVDQIDKAVQVVVHAVKKLQSAPQ